MRKIAEMHFRRTENQMDDGIQAGLTAHAQDLFMSTEGETDGAAPWNGEGLPEDDTGPVKES